MTTAVYDVTVTEVGDTLEVSAYYNGGMIKSVVLASEIETVGDLAEWLLAQTFTPNAISAALQSRVEIDYHTVPEVDDNGQQINRIVVDNVVRMDRVQDGATKDFSTLPGWASWSASEAENFIASNVVDLASAKVVLTSMAKAIVYLRDIVT